MGTNFQKNTMNSDTIILLSLLGEYHAPLETYNLSSSKGIILCIDSLISEDRWVGTLQQLPDITKITSVRRKSFSVPNYHLGIHFIRKYDSVEDLDFYLGQETFQPLAICSPFIPDEFTDLADTITLSADSLTNYTTCFNELANCKKYFRTFPENLMSVLKQTNSSGTFLQNKNAKLKSMLMEQLAVVAEIYLFWFQTGHSAEETVARKNCIQNHLGKLFEFHLNCDTTVDLANTFVHIFYKYLDSHTDISYCACDQIEGEANTRLNTGQTILWNAEYYFISSSLLKDICQPLLENIGWHKILRNLAREGVISADANQQSNYTCKKTLYNAFGQTSISRFIRLNKKALCSNEHLTLEERRQIHDTVSR